VARNRDSAIELLQNGWYDLAFCDLRIPPSEDDQTPDVVHGRAVIQEIQSSHSGMPMIVLSGYLTTEHREEFQKAGNQRDCFGKGTGHPMIRVHDKSRMTQAIEEIVSDGHELNKLDSIEINSRDPASLDLTGHERRVLKLFCRKVGGSVLRASRVRGGLSSSTVFKVSAEALDGSLKAKAYAKVGHWSNLSDELNRYNSHVSPILLPGDFATLYQSVDAGAGPFGGIFYQHAHIETINLYDLIQDFPSDVESVVAELEGIEKRWTTSGSDSDMGVADLERECLGDEADKIRELARALCTSDFSNNRFACRKSVQHFDLHGMNVLVHQSAHSSRPILIDFGQVCVGPACYDPIALELSLLFHPDASRLRGEWPTVDQVRRWTELPAYLEGCPIREFVIQCRRWTIAAKRGNREALACVYVYALRQLRFRDTNHEVAKALVVSAAKWYAEDAEITNM
jgi:CheY-like chemotaxis protein